MTVCVAALCTLGQSSMVVAASDRMLTYGDVEYEPSATKIWVLDDSRKIIALVSGEMSQQSVIVARATERIRAIDDVSVEIAAEIFAEEFARYRWQKNERAFLAPIGLNTAALLEPARVDTKLAETLVSRMSNTNLDDEVIVAGVNADNSKHIYLICDPGKAILMDTPGWVAIGSGRSHVDSEFTVEKYSRFWPFEQALLLTYTAKKRAESAPGVGADTDLSVVMDNEFDFLRDTIGTAVHGVHGELIAKEKEVRSSIMSQMTEIVGKAVEQPRAEETQPVGPPSAEPPTAGTGTSPADS